MRFPKLDDIAAAMGDIVGGLVDLAWPRRCIGCDMPGVSLCPDCESILPLIDQSLACSACGAPYGAILCTECWKPEGLISWSFSEAVCAMEHTGLGAEITRGYKDAGERGLAEHMSALMLAAIEERVEADLRHLASTGEKADADALLCLPAEVGLVSDERRFASSEGNLEMGAQADVQFHAQNEGSLHGDALPRTPFARIDLVTYVPATKAAIARRGFDHMIPIARLVAMGLGVECVEMLEGTERVDQRELGRHDRAANLQGVFRSQSAAGAVVLLVDDVMTTCATSDAAAWALTEAGAAEVAVACACRVW